MKESCQTQIYQASGSNEQDLQVRENPIKWHYVEFIKKIQTGENSEGQITWFYHHQQQTARKKKEDMEEDSID